MVGMPLIVLVVKVVMTMPLKKGDYYDAGACASGDVRFDLSMLVLHQKNACHDDFNNSRMTSPSKLSLSPSRRKTRRKHH